MKEKRVFVKCDFQLRNGEIITMNLKEDTTRKEAAALADSVGAQVASRLKTVIEEVEIIEKTCYDIIISDELVEWKQVRFYQDTLESAIEEFNLYAPSSSIKSITKNTYNEEV